MKKLQGSVLLSFFLSGGVFAQSSVTLYGVVDTSMLYQTHANKNNDSVVQMTDGAVNASRIGFRGKEDLGGGLSTIFDLEGGFQPQSGTFDSSNTIFNRHAYVGLQGDWGAVTLGRQDTLFFAGLGNYDPLTVGNYYNNSWFFYQSAPRYSSMVKYEGSFSGLSVGASYALGGTPGSIAAGSQAAFTLGYSAGPFSITGLFSQTHGVAGGVQDLYGFGASYVIGKATLYAGFVRNDDGSGTTEAGLTVQPVVRGVSTVKRSDTGFFSGAIYQVTPDVSFTAAYYYDAIKNAYATDGLGGHRQTVAGFVQYNLSKRTWIYLTADYNKASGRAALVELPGGDNQIEAGIGLHHSF